MARHQHRNSPKIQHAPENQWNVHPSYRGGATTTMGGYVWEFVGLHPLANRWGFVAQHRLVGEDLVDRPLRKGEVVHHRNNIRHDNRKENLEVMTVQAHRRHHWAELADLLRVPVDVEALKIALAAHGSVKGAARALGVSHSVLRNQFPDLCAPFQRRSPLIYDDPADIAAIRKAAADPNVMQTDVAKSLGMHEVTLQRICKKHGIVWRRKKWADDDPRRERIRANRLGLKVGEKRPAPVDPLS